MASYTVARAKHAQLTASEVDTVALGKDFREVMIVNRSGDAEIFYTLDSDADPTVGGDDLDIMPAAQASVLVISRSGQSPTVVKLISDGTPTYSVIGLD